MLATRRRRKVVVAAGACALVAAAVLLRGYLPGGVRPGGPLRDAPPHGFAITMRVGQTFTDGFDSLVVTGDKPATVNSVELVGGEGLQVVGFKLAGPDRGLTPQVFFSWPPTYTGPGQWNAASVIPGPGATIRPHEEAGWELLLGLKVTRPGPLWRDGLRINYTVDGTDYSRVLPAQLAVCTAAQRPKGPDPCRAPEDH